MKLLRRRCFWRRMTPVSSPASNYSLTEGERRSSQEEHRNERSKENKDVRNQTQTTVPSGTAKWGPGVARPRHCRVRAAGLGEIAGVSFHPVEARPEST